MEKLRLIAVALILLLMAYVALSPAVAYAPVPRLMLFFLSSAAVAVFLGAEASTRLKLKLPGFVLLTGGTGALALAILFVLHQFLKPELQVAIFDVYDERGRPVNVELDHAVELRTIPTNLPGFFIAQRNQLVVVFPELVVEQTLSVRPTTDSPAYEGIVTYAGTRQARLRLGTHLKRDTRK